MKTLKYIVYPFALLYGIIVSVRNLFFDIGILRSHRFPLYVISIGNLSVGGTGKSPHAEYIARLLENLNKNHENLDIPFNKIAILSRGYGRVTKGYFLVTNSSNANDSGDEPLQLKRRLNDVHVAVDESRVHGIKTLLASNPQLRTILLDDAYQHRYVKPDLSILLTNYGTPFYNDYMLPTGRLREPRRGYKRAQLIVVTNVPANLTNIEKKIILKDINPKHNQKVFYSSIIYQPLVPVFNTDFSIPGIDKSYSVLLLTGIANTDGLYTHLAEKVKDIVHLSFPDHHVFYPTDIAKVIKAFRDIANPNKVIITTEKDTMRLQADTFANVEFQKAPVFYLPISVKVHAEKDFEDALIASLPPLDSAKL